MLIACSRHIVFDLAAATLPASQLSHHIRSLQSELGDVLFDALMLNSICARDFGFDPAESWQAATAKVERRTPYMKEWGEKGVSAETSEEAEELWRAAKKEEVSYHLSY